MGKHTRKYRKQARQERRKAKKEGKVQVIPSQATKSQVPAKTSVKAATPITINGYTGRRFCHNGPIEIYPGLYLGSLAESTEMACFCDILVPLAECYGSIWDKGFRGEIWYYPTRDYNVLPEDVADQAVSRIIEALENKKKVGIFCLGGHGRTGYLACLVLGALDYADPIRYVRDNYCKLAVESNEQIKQIADKCEAPWLYDEYKEEEWGSSALDAWLYTHQNGGYGNLYGYGYDYGYGAGGWNLDNYDYGSNVSKSVIDHTKSNVDPNDELNEIYGENISDLLLDDGSRYYGKHTKDPLDDMDLDDSL